MSVKPTRRPDGFINVDLEVGARSRAALEPLADALGVTLFELFRGRIRGLYRGHYNSCRARLHDADRTINELARTVESLPRDARRAWDAAQLRDFNVGIELGFDQPHVELGISAAVVRRVAALGGRIVVTAYHAAPPSRGKARRK